MPITSLHSYGCHYGLSNIVPSQHMESTCMYCIKFGLCNTMSAQHNSNIRAASFICVIAGFFM